MSQFAVGQPIGYIRRSSSIDAWLVYAARKTLFGHLMLPTRHKQINTRIQRLQIGKNSANSALSKCQGRPENCGWEGRS